jgi:hypothetical protein
MVLEEDGSRANSVIIVCQIHWYDGYALGIMFEYLALLHLIGHVPSENLDQETGYPKSCMFFFSQTRQQQE